MIRPGAWDRFALLAYFAVQVVIAAVVLLMLGGFLFALGQFGQEVFGWQVWCIPVGVVALVALAAAYVFFGPEVRK